MLKKIIIYSDDGIISFLQDEKQFVSFIMGKFCPCGHTNNERSSIMSKEKTYLKWYNKVGYGSGDVAGNVVYALLTSFVMIYLTDTITASLTKKHMITSTHTIRYLLTQ